MKAQQDLNHKLKINKIWQNAKIHKLASIVGVPDDANDYHLCSCCNQPISKTQMPLCQHTKEFQIFGFGYPLWFSFLKYCIILVVILIVSKTSSQIYMATKQNYDFCYGNHSAIQNVHKTHNMGQQFENIHLKKNIYLRSFQKNYQIQQHYNLQLSQKKYSQNKKANNKLNHQFLTKQNIISNLVNHYSKQKTKKHHQVCTSLMIYASFFKGQQYSMNIFIRLIQFIIHVLALIGIRNMIVKEEQYYDQRTCSLSDYSLMIFNLPQVYNIQKKVKQFITKQLSNQDEELKIKQMVYIFKEVQIEQIQQQINLLKDQLIQAQTQNNNKKIQQIEKKLQHKQKQLQQLSSKIKSDINRDYIKCDKMIIVFNSQAEKKIALENFEQLIEQKGNYKKQNTQGINQDLQIDYNSYFYQFNQKKKKKFQVQLKQAPQPNQINWQHIDQSDIKRKSRILYGWILTLLFLLVITVFFYFIMLAKTNLFVKSLQMAIDQPLNNSVKNDKLIATIIVFATIFGVVLFNKFIMGKVLHYFVHLQRHAYMDKQNFSFALKYSLGMFFTTALMTLAVEAITFKNFYSHPFGVIQQQTIMFLVTAFLIPLIWLIHPYNLYKKIQLYFYKDKLVSSKKAHQLIQDFPYDLGKRSAQIFQIMWFTFLYSSLIPLGSFLVLIGLILYYWVDKYNFLRRATLKTGMSGKMAVLGLKALDATLFLAPAGEALFQYILHGNIDHLAIIFTILGIVYLFLPVSSFIQLINQQNFFLQQKTYDQAKNSFKQTYMTLHPMYKVTHKKQIQQHFEDVKKYYKNKVNRNIKKGVRTSTLMKRTQTQSN